MRINQNWHDHTPCGKMPEIGCMAYYGYLLFDKIVPFCLIINYWRKGGVSKIRKATDNKSKEGKTQNGAGEKRWRTQKAILNTADDDSFTQIPIMFGWLDPDEQRIRGSYLEEISEEEYPDPDEIYPVAKGPARIIPKISSDKNDAGQGKES
jgi:hypothetical protein